jgi:serine/threonine protein kinase
VLNSETRKVNEARTDDSLIGATLGGLYRVNRLIGIGGMGRVYEATHTHLGKAFAVKVLPEGRADRPKAVERFLREARAIGKIEHEHIVKVVNLDSDDEHQLFIVMERLEGESLDRRIARGPLPLEEALAITLQTADALQAAHDAGIVHRDLKPENIFITQRQGGDFVKVLDFGISKIKAPEQRDAKLTATDQIVGTPLYISPELARGDVVVDHRTDIYALGVILYEMLTGTPPFTGQNHFQLLYKHGNEAPDPPSQRSKGVGIPAHVESAILRALEKKPDDRFGSMQELSAALVATTTTKRARSFGIPLLFTAIVAGLTFVLWPRAAEAPNAPTRPAAVSEPPTTTKKSELPAETSEPEVPPALVTIGLDSRPTGASVTIDGVKKGKAPLTLELERGAEASVRFSLRGYRTEERRLVGEEDKTLVVRLRKKSRPTPPAIKTEF